MRYFTVLAGLFISMFAWAEADRKGQETRYESLELFQKVMHYVESNYVESVDHTKLLHGAIKGMLETLDPHSNFLPPEVYRDMKIDTAGQYGGIGLEMGVKDNVLTVVSPIEDTPAWRAGVKSGDRIIKINGESTKGMTLSEAIMKMKGKKGSSLKLSIYRKGLERPKDVVLMRETIHLEAVKSIELEPRIGYVRLTNFSERAAKDIAAAIKKFESKDQKLKGLVFDLRNNPGGLLDQAVEVTSLFVDQGVVVSTKGRNHEQEVRNVRSGMARKDFPIAVLVNESSASAAEIVAAALQDHHRAIIMGQPTFGKGSVQSVIDVGPDLGLKLTIARYYSPSGRSIQEKGVEPDVLLEDYDPQLLAEARRKRDGIREKDLKNHMMNEDRLAENEGEKKVDRGDFSDEELRQLTSESSEKDDSKTSKEKLAKWGPDPLRPKHDYQVLEAVNYLKSYSIFKRLATEELGGEPKEKKVATGERDSSQ